MKPPGLTTASPSPGQAKTRRLSTLKTTIREETMDRKNELPPVHPGEILREDICRRTEFVR